MSAHSWNQILDGTGLLGWVCRACGETFWATDAEKQEYHRPCHERAWDLSEPGGGRVA